MNREQRRAISKAKPKPVKRKTIPITWRHTEADETGMQLAIDICSNLAHETG